MAIVSASKRIFFYSKRIAASVQKGLEVKIQGSGEELIHPWSWKKIYAEAACSEAFIRSN
jgi:hypothetical protein